MSTYSRNSIDNLEKVDEFTKNSSNFLTNIESSEEKRLLKKIDLRIIPLVTVLYTLSFLDRVNIGNAKLANFERDINLTNDEYDWALGIFFLGYVIFDVPSNIALIKIKPSVWISTLMVVWGIIMTIMAFAKNFSELMVLRFLLGLFESGLFPGVIFYLTKWYKKSERNYRISLFFSGATIAGAFNGLLAYAITNLDVVSQLLSTPPFILGCISCIVVAKFSDCYGVRSPYLLLCILVPIAGYAILVIPNASVAVKYTAVCIIGLGVFSTVPTTLTWLTDNLAGDSKRAVGTAMMISWGNIGGVISAQLYKPIDAPAYKTGHSIALSLSVVAVIITIIQYYLLKRTNKYKLENPEIFLKGSNRDATYLGDSHPSFIYSL
ncbi:25487_t:CDS:2 [Gigaspora margarita]|uniref:25487_t:CDS:1 n=1 Tax=Gigaspora margarita TaxID=4874 RepID=A0ABN7V2W2_GIGMA|nr:25487_t:CDS:2 [Gigaspora margarita]